MRSPLVYIYLAVSGQSNRGGERVRRVLFGTLYSQLLPRRACSVESVLPAAPLPPRRESTREDWSMVWSPSLAQQAVLTGQREGTSRPSRRLVPTGKTTFLMFPPVPVPTIPKTPPHPGRAVIKAITLFLARQSFGFTDDRQKRNINTS